MNENQNNSSEINFEELLRQIEDEQKRHVVPAETPQPPTATPVEPVVQPPLEEPVVETKEEPLVKPHEEFKIHIADDDFAQEETPIVDDDDVILATPHTPQPIVHEDESEFATRDFDLEKEISQTRKKKKRKAWTSFLYLAGVLAVSVLLSVFIVNTARDVFGLAKPDQDFEIELGENTTVSGIAKSLDKAGIINSATVFKLYANMRYEKRTDVSAGSYILNSKMSYDELILTLTADNSELETVKVSFPEGMNIVEVAQLLEENKVCSAKDFLEAARGTYGFDFETEMVDDPLQFCRLEGYIFPNTHEFYVGENPESVIKRFLRDFQKNVMTPQLTERMEEMGMTLPETIILASMIQEEASYLDDMYKVSSVFHNRLRDNHDFPQLQSDVTYFYAYNTIDKTIDIHNEEMLNAYNTYERKGLPVGAITNPGLDAIKAALYPDETSYYYFVTDVNGKFYYASTLKGHQNNIYKAESVGDEVHGTGTQN